MWTVLGGWVRRCVWKEGGGGGGTNIPVFRISVSRVWCTVMILLKVFKCNA